MQIQGKICQYYSAAVDNQMLKLKALIYISEGQISGKVTAPEECRTIHTSLLCGERNNR